MPTAVIIGSGPAAAGAALALVGDPRQEIIVLDIGGQLEEGQADFRDALASRPEEDWPDDAVSSISLQPATAGGGGLPEKRTYGSDFPFRDLGQLSGVKAIGDANSSVISGAYGGFSNVWGAQIMPFSQATFDKWPISSGEMEPHYRLALDEMTLTGDTDDLSQLFPLLVPARPLPELAERTQRVLDRYNKQRARVQSHGITLGRARLAMKSESCTHCGLCMTGCPYGLIYSASHTFDRLRRRGEIIYRSGVLATHLSEANGRPQVHIQDLNSGANETISGDRIFVGCGGIGTTRLVLGSLELFGRKISLEESVQFVMPTISKVPTTDPRGQRNFTLNQFNLVYDSSGDGLDLCQIHFYPYNPVFQSSLPRVLQSGLARPLVKELLRRVSVGLGYLPSWASPKVNVTARRRGNKTLPEILIDRDMTSGWPPMLRDLSVTLLRTAPALDLWPILPMTSLSPAAKSYHFGGAFPHADRRSELATDRLGRLERWDNIHLIDASVFPNVPATTFTLTIMANAHRIATESSRLAKDD
jgi:choline dehydrogenase-like flavoprotein